MFHPRVISVALILALFVLCVTGTSHLPVNVLTLGAQTGNTCFSQNARTFYPSTTSTMTISPGVAIKYVNCFSQSPLFPLTASVTSGAIGGNTMTIQLNTASTKLWGGCTAQC